MAFEKELKRLNVEIIFSQKVQKLIYENNTIIAVKTTSDTYYSSKIILATGGLGYPVLGAEGDGYKLSKI